MPITFGMHVGQQNITIEELRRLRTHDDNNGIARLTVWDHFY